MIKSKAKIAFIVALLLMSVGVFKVVQVSANDIFGAMKDAGSAVKSESAVNDSMAVAIVEGEAITEEQIQASINLRKVIVKTNATLGQVGDQSVPSKDEIIKEMITRRVMLKKAKDMEITIDDAEIDAHLDMIRNAGKEDPAGWKTVQDTTEAFASGMGMTLDEYIETIMKPGMKEDLVLSKLYQEVISRATDRRMDIPYDEAVKVYEKFSKEALLQADVVYPDTSTKTLK